MRILGIDFETEGLDPKEHRIIEIGAALYDVEAGVPLQLMSELIDHGRPVPEEIVTLTGITTEAIQEFGVPEEIAMSRLAYMLDMADYGCAHNGKRFDQLFFNEALVRCGLPMRSKLWIDTLTDIPFPDAIKTRNLKHLAAEHEFVPVFAHRAIFDVLTMLKVVGKYDINTVIARAKEPLFYVQAMVNFDEKEKAKELGFRWFAPQKIWWREYKQSDLAAMKDTCGFKTRLLEGPLE